jgi:hypothetical protein
MASVADVPEYGTGERFDIPAITLAEDHIWNINI